MEQEKILGTVIYYFRVIKIIEKRINDNYNARGGCALLRICHDGNEYVGEELSIWQLTDDNHSHANGLDPSLIQPAKTINTCWYYLNYSSELPRDNSDSSLWVISCVTIIYEARSRLQSYLPCPLIDLITEYIFDGFLELIKVPKGIGFKSNANEYSTCKIELDDKLKLKDFSGLLIFKSSEQEWLQELERRPEAIAERQVQLMEWQHYLLSI
jgi:hypothetical protein